jgi:hypothetical protein
MFSEGKKVLGPNLKQNSTECYTQLLTIIIFMIIIIIVMWVIIILKVDNYDNGKKKKKLVHVENSKYHVTMLKGLQQCCTTILPFYKPILKTMFGSIPHA